MAALGFRSNRYYTAGTGETRTGRGVRVSLSYVAVGLRMM